MNNIYTWGSNKFKQTSSKDELHLYSPTLYPDFETLSPSRIAAGDNHTVVLTDYGDIYSFGRGIQGELGHPEKLNKSSPKLVEGLVNEVCVDVACGSLTSYAITASGRVYTWGLVLREAADLSEEDRDEHNAASGELTGLARDQNITVEVDVEARQVANREQPAGPRQLRDIVKESTERWMLATDGADEEYRREMRAMGYDNEELREKMDQRDKEYHGMLRLGCKRIIQRVPLLLSSIQHLKVVKIAAGYAHTMLLTDHGHLYSAGYNDRGQLGLGHRISTSEFKWIDYLANRFVVQVSCGQQHTICRALERNINVGDDDRNNQGPINGPGNGSTVYVGSKIGCDVYVWGNGMLGQLGLGRRGASKGRLLPTLVSHLQEKFPQGIVDVSAGHMFSSTVTQTGEVYSFGHAEYNQHGTGGAQGQDYTDRLYFYIPRQVRIEKFQANSKNLVSKTVGNDSSASTSVNAEHSSQSAHIVAVSCGSNYSVGIDIDGNAYSWGWNESGVLGHGIGYFSSEATKIDKLGLTNQQNMDPNIVWHVATGAKHVVAMTTVGSIKANHHYRFLLSHGKYADMQILVDDGIRSYKTFPCHRLIMSARSSYFRGYLQSAEITKRLYHHRNNIKDFIWDHYIHLPEEDDEQIFNIDLRGINCANPLTMNSLLEFIYTGKIHIIDHKRQQLAELAEQLCMFSLRDTLLHQIDSIRVKWSITNDTNQDQTVDKDKLLLKSFAQDMKQVFNSNVFADVVFTSKRTIENKLPAQAGTNSDTVGLTSAMTQFAISSDTSKEKRKINVRTLYAHKCVLSQMSYFDGMFNSNFKECAGSVDTVGNITSDITSNAILTDIPIPQLKQPQLDTSFSAPTAMSASVSHAPIVVIDVDQFEDDNISWDVFIDMLKYCYTGEVSFVEQKIDGLTFDTKSETSTFEDKPNQKKPERSETQSSSFTSDRSHEVMAMLVAANRFGHAQLALICEKEISLHLREDFPCFAEYCLEFSKAYNITRLERQCLEVLR